MADEKDITLTEEELALAREGETLVAAAVADVQTPQSLREGIERDRERAAARTRVPFWRRHRWALAMTSVVAAATAVGVVALQNGNDAARPPLGDVYAAAGLAPTEPPPAPLGGTPPVLEAEVGELEFPDWTKTFDWKAVGRRDDTLSGRTVTTVFYRNPEGARLGYAVVSGDPLGDDPPGRQVIREGKSYNVARTGGRTVVTWIQEGHTCVITAPSEVPQGNLVDLAASRNV